MIVLTVAGAAAMTLTGQVLTTVITFFLVLIVLKVYAWKPITELLDERSKTIAGEMSDLERKLADADARLREYEEKLRHIDDEARERHNKAVEEGRRMAAEVIDKARSEAEQITDKAREAMQHELEQARITLRNDAVDLAVNATEKLLAANLDDKRQRELAENFVAELSSRGAGSA
jgi:F-type H+-transporting ATPase subunit b